MDHFVPEPAVSDPVVGRPCRKRSYLHVRFACCNVYQRIYLNRKGTSYVGWCPRCAARVEVRVGPEGTDERFFVVS